MNLFIDFDGVICNTIEVICDLYNEDFQYYKGYRHINWFEVESWKFDELNCASWAYINEYFNQPRLFKNIKLFDYVTTAIIKMLDVYDITIVSVGDYGNLRIKQEWLSMHFPWCKFIGCEKDKKHVDMSGGIFIDDLSSNLLDSNAGTKICFGDEYVWNKDWNGIRCYNWPEVMSFLGLELENEI